MHAWPRQGCFKIFTATLKARCPNLSSYHWAKPASNGDDDANDEMKTPTKLTIMKNEKYFAQV